MKIERQFVFWLVACVAMLGFIAILKDVLLPFIVGMILAYALNPVADAVVRRGLPRVAASAVVVALIVLMLGLAMWFLVPPLVAQVEGLAETMPAGIARIRTLIEDLARERLGSRFGDVKTGIDKSLAGLEIDWSSILPAVAGPLWTKGLAVANLLWLVLITPLVVFYLLVDWHPMVARVEGWIPRDKVATVRRLFGEMDAAVGAFVRGQGVVCLILGVFYAVGLSLVGLRYGLLIGLATGLLSFVPFAGWALGFMVSAIAMLVQAWPDPEPLYLVAGVFVAGMALDTAVLSPRIVGSRVGLHPLWLIFALMAFSYAMGFVGMLLAVPLAAAFAVLVRHGLEVYLGSEVYRGKAAAGGQDVGPTGSIAGKGARDGSA